MEKTTLILKNRKYFWILISIVIIYFLYGLLMLLYLIYADKNIKNISTMIILLFGVIFYNFIMVFSNPKTIIIDNKIIEFKSLFRKRIIDLSTVDHIIVDYPVFSFHFINWKPINDVIENIHISKKDDIEEKIVLIAKVIGFNLYLLGYENNYAFSKYDKIQFSNKLKNLSANNKTILKQLYRV